jgi:hypothetical protein
MLCPYECEGEEKTPAGRQRYESIAVPENSAAGAG